MASSFKYSKIFLKKMSKEHKWVFFLSLQRKNGIDVFDKADTQKHHDVHTCSSTHTYTLINTHAYVRVCVHASSSSSCRAASTVIPDPLSAPFPIIHRF